MADDLEAAEAVTRRDVIRAAGLTVDDPELIDGLVFPIPPGRELRAILKDYDTQRTTGHKIRCSACPQHQAHFRGFVVELDDGSQCLVGINCGETHFGAGQWNQLHVELRREQDRAYYDARVGPTLAEIEACYPLIMDWRDSLDVWSAFLRDLKTTMPSVGDTLREACLKNEGHLHRYVRRKAIEQDRSGDMIDGHTIETVSYGRVPHPEAFLNRTLNRNFDGAIAALRLAKKMLTPPAKLPAIIAGFAELRKGRRYLENVAAIEAGHRRNAELDWWEGACRYCEAVSVESLKLRGRILVETDWETRTVHIPDPSKIPTTDAEAVMRAWPVGS